jgi:hypothetical protein
MRSCFDNFKGSFEDTSVEVVRGMVGGKKKVGEAQQGGWAVYIQQPTDDIT